MRSYFAVIQDSFREALASRVLWVLLVLITLLLLVLAPLGYRQQVTRDLAEGAVRDLPRFIEHLRDESQTRGAFPRRSGWCRCSTNRSAAMCWRFACPRRATFPGPSSSSA